MATKGTIINPVQEEVEARQRQAESTLRNLADNIQGVSSAEGADIRDLLPQEDLQSGDDNGWGGGNHEWAQSGLTADGEEIVYDINSNDRAQDKILLIYGVANVAATPLTTEIAFRTGNDAVFRRANVETFEIVDISDVILFKEDIIYPVTADGSIVQWPNADGDDKVVYLGKVIEPQGDTLTPRREGEQPQIPGR